MIKSLKNLLLLSLTFLMISCEESDPKLAATDYLVFGKFHGFCIGDGCVQIFKLDSSQLSKDTLHKYPNREEFYQGAFTNLANAKFEAAANLLHIFPDQLFSETDTVFGCPDCADQGGYYIEVKIDDTHRFWILDTSRGSVPEYLHEFMDEVDETMEMISE